MAEYSFTPADIDPQGATGQHAVAGEAIDAGELIYLDATDLNKAKLAKSDTVAKAAVVGMALNSAAAAGQPITYLASGEVVVDAATFAGVGRILVITDTTAGKVMDASGLGAGDYITIVGYSSAANKITLGIVQSGLAYS